jgi:hypothetical protein
MSRIEKIQSLLHDCVREYAEQVGTDARVDGDTPLMGPGSPLDSIGLVMVVTDFETRLNQSFDAQLVLANERAMSMNHSPFRSIAALTQYADELLREAGRE